MILKLLNNNLLTTVGGSHIILVSTFGIPPVYHPIRMVLPAENDPAHIQVASGSVLHPVRMVKPAASDPVQISVASSNE